MAEPWTASAIWRGATVVCAAPGPSLTAPVCDRLRVKRLLGEVRVLAVGDAYRLLPWADAVYHADTAWWHLHWPQVGRLAAMKVTIGERQNDGRVAGPVAYGGVLYLANAGPNGFDPDPACLRTGLHSGYQALHLAAHTGAAKVLLVGYDTRLVDGRRHFFGEHPEPLNRDSPYPQFAAAYREIAGPLAERGVEVLNCTPGSAIQDFPFKTLEDAL